jgi:hypothetical protein
MISSIASAPVRMRATVEGHMPTISRFFGIAIRMYYDDHDPPHFHAYYGEESAKI